MAKSAPGRRVHRSFLLASLLFARLALVLAAQEPHSESTYVLGPGDQISVTVRDVKELEIKPSVIALDGTVEFAYTGKIAAAGMTTDQLAREIEQRLRKVVRNPKIMVDVSEYGSQPVSILGAVNKPGVHQLHGRKTLVEVLSLAEGLKSDAGNGIKITRPASSGSIPLQNARPNVSGQFSTAEINIKALLEATAPETNILIRPDDVISVPKAELIYVMGNVKKPGGFPLSERESITVLQALAMAEGIDATGAAGRARILRNPEHQGKAQEVPIDVKKILANEAPDQALQPNDVLFIPDSKARSASLRILEAGLQMGTGLVIYRR
jgi:polysaccharide biosynthesis/export protein